MDGICGFGPGQEHPDPEGTSKAWQAIEEDLENQVRERNLDELRALLRRIRKEGPDWDSVEEVVDEVREEFLWQG